MESKPRSTSTTTLRVRKDRVVQIGQISLVLTLEKRTGDFSRIIEFPPQQPLYSGSLPGLHPTMLLQAVSGCPVAPSLADILYSLSAVFSQAWPADNTNNMLSVVHAQELGCPKSAYFRGHVTMKFRRGAYIILHNPTKHACIVLAP